MQKDTSEKSDEELGTAEAPIGSGGQMEEPVFKMPEWKISWLQDDEPEAQSASEATIDDSVGVPVPPWSSHPPLPQTPLMLCSPPAVAPELSTGDVGTSQGKISSFIPRLQIPYLMEENTEITWDPPGEDGAPPVPGVGHNPTSEGTINSPVVALRLKDPGHLLQLSQGAPDESFKAGYLTHDAATRRFSPRSDAEIYGRALSDLIDFPGAAATSDLLPLESGPLLPKEEEESHLEQIAEEHRPSGLAEEAWATLRRAAALGLQPGEDVVDTPRVCEFNPIATQFQVFNPEGTEDSADVAHLPDIISSDLPPLPSEWPKENTLVKEVDSVAPVEPKSTLLEIPESMRPHVGQPELIDMRGLPLGPEVPSWNPDQSVMTFPQPTTDEDFETHPFFTTMEIKNQAFSRTGSLDSDLEKVSKEIESEAWSRGSDDKVVGGRFSRKRRAKKSK